MTGRKMMPVRCAIYTRKSSEEGLEQDFNSLDAQREACEAYITSQKHEGWCVLPQHYEDGGKSGAGMNRPALQQLLAAIRSRKVDTIVVYKIDRLTRSLADFARMVELFDDRGITFVSVTQQFNTTTSMGRLTLNVLLSFAQFEREVTGERIRDKIAASKKKGMWMGGNLPLGYDTKDRKLIINGEEADQVRHIFRRYREVGSVFRLSEVLASEGILSKVRISAKGRRSGGVPFHRGALYHLLQNRIYLGEITHKGHCYPGRQEPIVGPELWDQVQARLAENRVGHHSGERIKDPALLAGLLFDGEGNRMTPGYAVKNGKRYRYYLSRSLTTGPRRSSPAGLRIPAREIEQLLSHRLQTLFTSTGELVDVLSSHITGAGALQQVIKEAAKLAEEWPAKTPSEKRSVCIALIQRITIRDQNIILRLPVRHLCRWLQKEKLTAAAQASPTEPALTLKIDFDLRRCGYGLRMLINGMPAGGRTEPDRKLIRLIVTAHRIRQKLTEPPGRSLADIAAEEGYGSSYATRLLRLAFLSPKITTAILNGRQPAELTPVTLMRNTKYPLDWQQQLPVFRII